MSFQTIVLIGLFLILSNVSYSQGIMSYEQYQQIDHVEPYIYQIDSKKGTLLYFGSRHSFDPTDHQFDTLKTLLNQFDPDIIITEAYPEKFDHSLDINEAIKTSGEFGLTWKWARENNVPTYSLEPKKVDEVNHLKKLGWSETELIVNYTLKQVASSPKQVEVKELYDLLPSYLASLKERFDLDGPKTYAEFEKEVTRLLPDLKNWVETPVSYFYPGPQDPEYFTNQISTDSNIFRDKYHLKVIAEAIRSGNKVFVISGSAHAVMQQPALRYLLK